MEKINRLGKGISCGFIAALVLLSVSPASYGQRRTLAPIDSIDQLIKKEKDPKARRKLVLERAARHPPDAYDRAMVEIDEVFRESEQAGDNEGLVAAYLAKASVNHNGRKSAEGFRYDSLALQLAEKIGYTKGKAQSYENFGAGYYFMGNIQEAKVNHEKALELTLSLPAKEQQSLHRQYNQLGVVHRILGQLSKASEYFELGITKAEEAGEQRSLAQLYMNLGNVLGQLGQYEKAAQMHYESIKIKEGLSDTAGIAQSYANLGMVFKSSKETDKAIEYLKKAQALQRQINDFHGMGLAASNIALLHIEKKDLDSVPGLFEEAIAYFKKAKDNRGLALAYHNYGNFLFKETTDLATARKLMDQALEIRKRAGSTAEASATLANIGDLEIRQGNYGEAERYLKEALAGTDTSKASNALADVYSYFSKLYEGKGEYGKALEYLKRRLAIDQELYSDNERVALLRTENNFEIERRDLQLALERQKQAERQSVLVLVGILAVVVLAAVFGILWFRRKQTRERHLAELQRLDQQHRLDTSKALRRAEEDERKKIAGRLHDEVGALLSIAKLNVDQLSEDAFAVDSGAVTKLHATQKLLGDVSETVRSVSHSLMPIALEKYGLKAAVLDLIGAVNASGKVVVEDVIEGFDDTAHWSDEFRLGLYRIVQEVINNVIKHSGATHVLVQLVELEQSITLYVEDNGKGFEAAEAGSGIGLNLLRSNVAYFNGAIEIDGKRNQGTFVLIELPIN